MFASLPSFSLPGCWQISATCGSLLIVSTRRQDCGSDEKKKSDGLETDNLKHFLQTSSFESFTSGLSFSVYSGCFEHDNFLFCSVSPLCRRHRAVSQHAAWNPAALWVLLSFHQRTNRTNPQLRATHTPRATKIKACTTISALNLQNKSSSYTVMKQFYRRESTGSITAERDAAGARWNYGLRAAVESRFPQKLINGVWETWVDQ